MRWAVEKVAPKDTCFYKFMLQSFFHSPLEVAVRM